MVWTSSFGSEFTIDRVLNIMRASISSMSFIIGFSLSSISFCISSKIIKYDKNELKLRVSLIMGGLLTAITCLILTYVYIMDEMFTLAFRFVLSGLFLSLAIMSDSIIFILKGINIE